jgi:hypothetical protein
LVALLSHNKLLDWLPWYPTDFWGSVRVLRLSEAACNLYRWMLDYQWIHGSVPDDAVVVSRLYPWGPSALDSWREVRPLFDSLDGALVNPKLAAVYAESCSILDRKALGGRRSAQARKDKYGTAAPGAQKADAPKTLQNTLPKSLRTEQEHRIGPDLTGTEKKKRAPRVAADAAAFSIPSGIDTPAFRDVWGKWLRYRRELGSGKALTVTGGNQQLTRCATLGEARATAALQHTMEQGWVGMREPNTGTAPPAAQQRDAALSRYPDMGTAR